jgi:hypothetical protein
LANVSVSPRVRATAVIPAKAGIQRLPAMESTGTGFPPSRE